MTIGYICGFIGALLTLISYLMKSMMPLRIVALGGNAFLVAYGYFEAALPTLMLYALMIPINIKKVRAIRKLVRDMESAKADSPVAEWLLPHMTQRQAKAGETLWKKGDVATEMLYVHAGRLRLVEYDEPLEAGSLIGEIGLFSPDNRRTQTVTCETDCTLYSLSKDGMAQLYYINPKLGYHVMRLIVARLMHDADVLRARAEHPHPVPAAQAQAG